MTPVEKKSSSKQSHGLVLSGGGARGAYQVGVLAAIADIAKASQVEQPFDIYTGVSAGAINATFLAAEANDFSAAAKDLVDLWSQLTSDKVFYSDLGSIGKIGVKWMKSVSIGGITGPTPGQALLDTTPLHELIRAKLPFENIQKHLDEGVFKCLAITALDYHTSTAVTFVQGDPSLPEWQKSRRHSEKARITAEHVLGSASIPLLFPPVGVGDRFFGDGCIRNSAPCSPSIYLGAQKLMVIGVRTQTPTAYDHHVLQSHRAPSVGRVLNVLLNSVMLDGIEVDIDRLGRINTLIERIPAELHEKIPYRKVDFVWISPSMDIGEIARQKHMKLPPLIRYLLKGLGSIDDASEIVSYLLFDPSFCTDLIEIGYEDGMRKKEEIRRFLLDP